MCKNNEKVSFYCNFKVVVHHFCQSQLLRIFGETAEVAFLQASIVAKVVHFSLFRYFWTENFNNLRKKNIFFAEKMVAKSAMIVECSSVSLCMLTSCRAYEGGIILPLHLKNCQNFKGDERFLAKWVNAKRRRHALSRWKRYLLHRLIPVPKQRQVNLIRQIPLALADPFGSEAQTSVKALLRRTRGGRDAEWGRWGRPRSRRSASKQASMGAKYPTFQLVEIWVSTDGEVYLTEFRYGCPGGANLPAKNRRGACVCFPKEKKRIFAP